MIRKDSMSATLKKRKSRMLSTRINRNHFNKTGLVAIHQLQIIRKVWVALLIVCLLGCFSSKEPNSNPIIPNPDLSLSPNACILKGIINEINRTGDAMKLKLEVYEKVECGNSVQGIGSNQILTFDMQKPDFEVAKGDSVLVKVIESIIPGRTQYKYKATHLTKL